MARYGVLLLMLAMAGCGCMAMQKAYPAGAYAGGSDSMHALERAKAGSAAPSGEPANAPGKPQKSDEMAYLSAIEPRKVVYTGRMSIVVADVRWAVASAKAIAEKAGGYLQASTLNSVVLRVPAKEFEPVMSALEKAGTVTDRRVEAQDVTEQYVDLELRIKNVKALLDKLQALLDKAPDVKTALEVEKELARARTELEQLQGQLNRLASQVAFSTITVNFSPTRDAPAALKVALPFDWLKRLGLDCLLSF